MPYFCFQFCSEWVQSSVSLWTLAILRLAQIWTGWVLEPSWFCSHFCSNGNHFHLNSLGCVFQHPTSCVLLEKIFSCLSHNKKFNLFSFRENFGSSGFRQLFGFRLPFPVLRVRPLRTQARAIFCTCERARHFTLHLAICARSSLPCA